MIAYLKVEEGISQGKVYELRSGDQIGRTQGNIIIDDSRISALHAQVEIDHRNHLVLVDMNSSNGLQINGKRVKRIALLEGVHFLLGKTPVLVTQVDETGDAEDHSWRTALARFGSNFENLKFSPVAAKSNAEVFSPAIRLKFTQGAFYGHSWTLGFGPREIGAMTHDLLIGDVDLPPVAFELVPSVGGADIIVKSGFPILVNGQPIRRHELREKDKITCGKHVLTVEFVK